MPVQISDIDNWIKTRYINSNEHNKGIAKGKNSPVFQTIGMQKAVEDGKDWEIPVIGSQKKTSGRDFSSVRARNYNNGATGKRFTFKHGMVPNFDEVDMDREAMLTAKNMRGSFGNQFKRDIKETVFNMENDVIRHIYGGQSVGQIAKVKTVTGTSFPLTIVLEPDFSMHNLDAGMIVEFAAAKYGGTTDNRRKSGDSTDAGKKWEIVTCNKATRTITVNATKGSFAAATDPVAADLVWREGDYLKSNESAQPYGFKDYMPSSISDTNTTKFLNVNRNVSPDRLAGRYLKPTATRYKSSDNHGSTLYKALMEMMRDVHRFFPEFGITRIYCSPTAELILKLSDQFLANTRYLDAAEKKRVGAVGFTAFRVRGPKGNVPLIVDPFCPDNSVFGIYHPVWKVKYLADMPGSVVNFKKESGSYVLLNREQNSNVVYLESYMFLCCELPGSNFHLDISNLSVTA